MKKCYRNNNLSTNIPKIFVLSIFLICNLTSYLTANEFSYDFQPIAVIDNPCSHYTLVNSVDFHPKDNVFCVTYTHGNRVTLYQVSPLGQPHEIQTIRNPEACLSDPQHAVFYPDGKKIFVVNWTNQTFTIYQKQKDNTFKEAPTAIIPFPNHLLHCRPHGIAISPCGNFFAIAFGVTYDWGRAIALYQVTKSGNNLELTSVLEGSEVPGIPKGITFSPNGKCLLVTFADNNSIALFDINRKYRKILTPARQVIQGSETKISRPEDIKMTANGDYCAISNSDQHNVTFYFFDKKTNRITQNAPVFTFEPAPPIFYLPHGISFSADGSLLAVTEFGSIRTVPDGNVTWDKWTPAKASKVHLYKVLHRL